MFQSSQAMGLILLLCLLGECATGYAQTASQREYYLGPLIYPISYRPAKNSFIFQNLKRGEKKTLADVRGSGSLRHVWTTWARSFEPEALAEKGQVLFRIFVDGEKMPSVAGSIDQLFEAAGATGEKYVPEPAFNYEGAFNSYLPVFYQTGLRVEIEALADLEEFYAQLDYRITKRPESKARLVSQPAASGMMLRYVGRGAPSFKSQKVTGDSSWRTREIVIPAGGERDVIKLKGPAILKELTIETKTLEGLRLLIFWDNEAVPSVSAPIKYFFGGFDTLALRSAAGRSSCYFPMAFLRSARIRLHNQDSTAKKITIRGSIQQNARLPQDVRYFHASFQEAKETTGYSDFVVLDIHGAGHFVGVTLFDSGHNHGGGDTALIDAGTSSPLVLHGINGEDYFSFAWHKTGRMHLFAGAPQHERRYRFHLENPYPFRSSIRFAFGVFAGLNPKAVAFWYQEPSAARNVDWTPDIPWKVFGPVDERLPVPEKVDERSYDAEVTLAKPEQFLATWEDALMDSGFLDLTHHYRHFLTARKGTGFVAGSCQSKAVTYVYSPKPQILIARIGHDDLVEVSVNEGETIKLPEQTGFHVARVVLTLRRGWNELSVNIHNRENITWRWTGISLALLGDLRHIKFSSAPFGASFHMV